MAHASYIAPDSLDRLRQRALVVGAIGLLATGAEAFLNPAQFFHSYLLAFMFVLAAALGSLALLMLQHMSGGAWGVVTRRIFEAGAGTMPWMALFFLPLLFGIRTLYPWADPAVVSGDRLLQEKAAFLNVPFWAVRAILYFVIWTALARLLIRWSAEHDVSGAPALVDRMHRLSAAGLVLYAVTMTLASVDWVMSLEPHWFSTMFGFLFMSGQGLVGLSLAIIVAHRLSTEAPMDAVYNAGHFHDLGKLLFAFTMLWAYLSFSQFLIIWSANLPEEIPWYMHRLNRGWEWVGLALVVLHFAVPFLVLLSRKTKRSGLLLSYVAAWMIGMRLVDLFNIMGPEFYQDGFKVGWTDITATIGLACVWVSIFLSNLKARSLLPLNDREFASALSAEHAH
jgi:hypothetical protein